MLIESFLTRYMRYAVRQQTNMRSSEGHFLPTAAGDRTYLLYIHVPFCETLCPYCLFNRIRFEPAVAARYFRALRREVEAYRDRGFNFDAVYIGGGTPTVLPGELASLLDFLRGIWPIKQVSVETHTQHLLPDTIATLKNAGIDRLSIGVQTFNDDILRKLSRLENHDSGRAALARLEFVKDKFDTVNVDMIYNFPGQTLDMLSEDLRIIRELGISQVTFYPLMEGGKDFQKTFGKVDLRREKIFYERIVAELTDAYSPVSAWCFTRKKGLMDEYIVSHDEHVALGAGSFGYVDGTLYANAFDVEEYIRRADNAQLPVVAARMIGVDKQMRYDLLRQLFSGSLDLSYLKMKYDTHPALSLSKEILFFLLTGAVIYRDRRLLLTSKGQYYLVILMREFFSGLNQMRTFLGRNGRHAGPAGTHARTTASCKPDASGVRYH